MNYKHKYLQLKNLNCGLICLHDATINIRDDEFDKIIVNKNNRKKHVINIDDIDIDDGQIIIKVKPVGKSTSNNNSLFYKIVRCINKLCE
jgi:hypothetical protein